MPNKMGVCSDWAGGFCLDNYLCTAERIADAADACSNGGEVGGIVDSTGTYSKSEVDYVRRNCPLACGVCAAGRASIGRSGLPAGAPLMCAAAERRTSSESRPVPPPSGMGASPGGASGASGGGARATERTKGGAPRGSMSTSSVRGKQECARSAWREIARRLQ